MLGGGAWWGGFLSELGERSEREVGGEEQSPW